MSLILEALRKSEAERRRAQAPDLFAPAQVAVSPVRRLPPTWMLAAAALALLALAWLVSRAFWPGSPAREVSVATAVGNTPVDRASVGDTESTSVESTSVDRMPAERMPAEHVPPASVADTSNPTRAAAAGSADATTVATTPSAPAPPRRLPAPIDERVADAAASPAIKPVHASADPAAVADNLPDILSAAPVASRAAADAPVPDATVPPVRLSELAADERRQLPPMKLTMHMWNEAPDRRFVILDGRRVAEGDRLGPARVAEIRRDGVILDWNGQRLELPLH